MTGQRLQTLQAMIPSYGQSLREDHGLLANVRNHTLSTLGLTSGTNQPDSERSLYA